MTPGLARVAGRLALAAFAAGLAVVGASAPALAADTATGRIVEIGGSNGQLQIVFTGQNLANGQNLDPTSVAVTAAGQKLDATATRPDSGSTVKVDRTAVLVIDVSGSMLQDNKIVNAKSAARAYVGAVPADVKVGLVTFDNTARTIVSPTTNRGAVSAAINAIQPNPQGGTALYDGVLRGVQVAGTQGLRSVLLISDGADDGSSKTSPAAAAAAVKASQVAMDAVQLPGKDSAPLGPIVAPARGQVIPAQNAAALTKAFEQAALAISNQLLITAALPKDLTASSGNVTVSAKAGSQTLTDTALASFTSASPVATTSAAAYGPKPVAVHKPIVGAKALPFALGALFLGLVVLLVVALTSVGNRDGREGRVRRRLSIYTFTGRQPVKQQETTALGDSNVARSAVEFAGKVVAKRDFEEVLGQRLEAAGVPLRAAEWLLIHIGMTLALGLLFLLVFGGSLIPALIGLALGFLAPYVYLSVKEARRTSAFLAQLPDTLQLLAGSLSAGYSLPQAVDTVVREGQPPITVEFNRALVEARLGVPLEDALEGVGIRMKSKDFSWVVMAIRIQREVGGNLAEVLSTVAATLRERERLRRQVKVLSAEGRLSAWILGLLPVTFALYLVLVRPDYLHPLVTQALGWVMIVVGSALLVTGAFWLRKVVRVEV